jgi:predicted RNase H-like nuclease
MNLGSINLLGIDVGFSQARPTTGVAWSADGTFGAAKTHTDWERRRVHLPPSTNFSVVAIDGPLVPDGSSDLLVRTCEQLLARGTFQKRCKPGSSHFGTGLQLKRAAHETAKQIRHLTSAPVFLNAVFRDLAIVEAFPNAFLGVLLSDQTFATDKIQRGKKFDWMYEHAVKAGKFGELLAFIGWDASDLLKEIEAERDHEKRAAYLCLLTAACAAVDKAEVVGDISTGWIWLPPAELWEPWAREALEKNRMALA